MEGALPHPQYHRIFNLLLAISHRKPEATTLLCLLLSLRLREYDYLIFASPVSKRTWGTLLLPMKCIAKQLG